MRKIVFISFIFLTHCATKTKDPNRSEFLEPRKYESQFGFLYNPSTRLIAKPNGSSIEICGGSQFSELKKAIEIWGKAINKTYKITNTCKNPSIFNYTRTDHQTEEEVFRWSFLSARWYSNDLAFVSADGKRIYNAMDRPMPWRVVLHEVGHMFGLCDQYKAAIQNCARTTRPVAKSIMLDAWSYDALQEDDIEGIRNLEADYKRIPMDTSYLSKEELDEYVHNTDMHPLEKKRWQLCDRIKNKDECNYNDCVWDLKSGCLSSLLSSCSKASSEEICKQIMGCGWETDGCDFVPLI